MSAPKRRRFRDVVTGLFVSAKKAKASPEKTVGETYGPTFSDRLFAEKLLRLADWHTVQAEAAITVGGNVASYEFHWQAAKDLNSSSEQLLRKR